MSVEPNDRALQRIIEAWRDIPPEHIEGIIKGYLIAALMEDARKVVAPLIASEREGEKITGDIMGFRMGNGIEVEASK